MTDGNEGTTEGTAEAPATDESTAPATETGTPQTPDEVTTLRSRNAGLDAKVTSLAAQAKADKARADAAEARALALAEAKEGGDAELRAELERMKAENAAARKDAALARIEAKYPETFGVLGETAASLSEDQLAASEARYAGVPAEAKTPTPGGSNPARTPAAIPNGEETGDQIEARLLGMTAPWSTRT